ncbi:MAG: serine hydrolase [Balneolaceae bacterium]|nr:serine hydrolase [Balneolaceae bacterium]
MKRYSLLFLLLLLSQNVNAQYFPGQWGDWETRTPEQMGFNADSIAAVIEYAQANETTNPRSMEENHYGTFGREPFGDGVGPFKDRGDQTGIIIKDGYIIAEWGEPFRVDMTHSVTKTFLSSTVGIAYDLGLIRDVHDKVDAYMAPILMANFDGDQFKADEFKSPKVIELFKGEHNSKITWDHLLRQTSDWEGTLFGKPEWADRPDRDRSTWLTRERYEPGSEWEYNDVRVNLLALAAMNVFRKPLPVVLREQMMDKIGASPTWRWQGYETSWVVIDGQLMQSVSGGGHWGGGMFISARDQARLGLLTLNEGNWDGEQIISKEWIELSKTPTDVNTGYGYMNYFLNTDREAMPSAPESAFWHLGAGTNMVYCDPENNLVIVARWINRSAMEGIVKRVIGAIEK